MTKVPFLAVVAESFHGESDELSLTEGTEVIVVQVDNDGWYTVHTKDAIGIFPGSYLDAVEEIRLPIKAKVALPFIELNLLPGDVVTVNDISTEGWMIEAKNTIGYCTWDYLDIIMGSSAGNSELDIDIPDIGKSGNSSSLIGIKPIQSDPKLVEPSPINPVPKPSPQSTLNQSMPARPVASNPNQARASTTGTPPTQLRGGAAPGGPPRGGPGGPRGGGPGPAQGSPNAPLNRGRPLSTSGGPPVNRGRPLSVNQGQGQGLKPAAQPSPPPVQNQEAAKGTPPAAPARRPTVTASATMPATPSPAQIPQPPARKPTVTGGKPPGPPGAQQKPPANAGGAKTLGKVSIAPSARDKPTKAGGPTRATPSILDTKPGDMVTSRYSTYRRPVSIFAGAFKDESAIDNPYYLATLRSGGKVELEGRFEFKATEYLPAPPAFSGCQKNYVTLMPSYVDWEAKIRSAQFDI